MSNLLITTTIPINYSKNVNPHDIDYLIIKFDKIIEINSTGKNVKLLKKDGINIIIDNDKLSVNNNKELKIDIVNVSLENFTEYSVFVPNNLIINKLNGKYFEGIDNSATNKWNFTTLDLKGPEVINHHPKKNDINVSEKLIIELTFNKNIKLSDISSKKIKIKPFGIINPQTIEPLIKEENISISKDTLGNLSILNINLGDDQILTSQQEYTVIIPNFFISDDNDIYFGGYQQGEYKFFIRDWIKPKIIQYNPLNNLGIDNKIYVKKNQEIKLIFNKPIQINDSDVIFKSSNSQIISNNYKIENLNNLIIELPNTNPPTYLKSNTIYHLLIENDLIHDYSSPPNYFEGLKEGEFMFRTVDYGSPVALLNLSIPKVNSIDINDNISQLKLKFDENVKFTSNASHLQVKLKRIEDNFVIHISSENFNIDDLDKSLFLINIPESAKPLSSESEYSIIVPDDLISDLDNNNFNGINGSDINCWKFTIKDSTNPEALSCYPENNSVNISQDIRRLTILFNEKIKLHNSENNIYLKELNSTKIINISNKKVDPENEKQLLIDLKSSVILQSEKKYSVIIPDNIISDMSNNYYLGVKEGDSSINSWVFTIKDYSQPLLLSSIDSLTPENNAINVEANNLEIKIKFNENITKDNTHDKIYLQEKGLIWSNIIDINDISIESNNTLILKISESITLKSSTTYYLVIKPNVIYDENGNNFQGFDILNNSYEFTIKDYKTPKIIEYNPSNELDYVPLDLKNIKLIFDENIKKTVSTNNIILKNKDKNTNTTILNSNLTVLDDNILNIRIDDGNNLESSTNYSLIIPNDIVEDYKLNRFEGIEEDSYIFRSADVILPHITTYKPYTNQTEVDLNTKIELTFSEKIKINPDSSNNISLNYTKDGENEKLNIEYSDLTIIPSGPGDKLIINIKNELLSNTQYSVIIPNNYIKDLSGNKYVHDDIYKFTTKKSLYIKNYKPARNSINVGKNEIIELTFNKDIKLKNGTAKIITIYSYETREQGISNSNVTINNNKLIINIKDSDITLKSNSLYTINIPNNFIVFKDDSEVIFNGILGNYYQFSVEDYLGVDCIDNCSEKFTNNTLNTITLKYNYNIDYTNGELILQSQDYEDNFKISNSNIKVTENNVLLTVNKILRSNINYILNIPSGIFKRVTEGMSEIINQEQKYTIKLDSYLDIIEYIPVIDSSNVQTNIKLRFKFNKNIEKDEISENHIILHQSDDTGAKPDRILSFSKELSIKDEILTIDFSNQDENLLPNTNCSLTIPNNYLKSEDGTHFKGLTDYKFKTGDGPDNAIPLTFSLSGNSYVGDLLTIKPNLELGLITKYNKLIFYEVDENENRHIISTDKLEYRIKAENLGNKIQGYVTYKDIDNYDRYYGFTEKTEIIKKPDNSSVNCTINHKINFDYKKFTESEKIIIKHSFINSYIFSLPNKSIECIISDGSTNVTIKIFDVDSVELNAIKKSVDSRSEENNAMNSILSQIKSNPSLSQLNQNSFLSPELETDISIIEPFISNSNICSNCFPIYAKNDHNIYPSYFKTKYNETRISSTEVRYNTEIYNIHEWKYNNFEQYLQAKKMANIDKYNTTL